MQTKTAQHTPGPWNYTHNDRGGITIYTERRHAETAIAVVGDSRAIHIFPGKSEQQANANLIAAAPAMLEALKECVQYFDKQFPRMNFGIPEQCRQAIAQAEGQ